MIHANPGEIKNGDPITGRAGKKKKLVGNQNAKKNRPTRPPKRVGVTVKRLRRERRAVFSGLS